MKPFRVGTRGSALAITQTEQVIETLCGLNTDAEFELVTIKTTGDERRDLPFAMVNTKGMFVKELEDALLTDDIDFAVHSLKDMPSDLPAGLTLASTPKRLDPRDAFVSIGLRLDELPQGARVGTSSMRRQAQLRHYRMDLRLSELRGNLDTRLRKLDDGLYDAIILACAGLERLGMADHIVERLPMHICLPAPGQGALALEARSGDTRVYELLRAIHDVDTGDAVTAERGFQGALGAGCTVPAGAFADIHGHEMRIRAMVAHPDGVRTWKTEVRGPRADAFTLGVKAALNLLGDGAQAAIDVS